MGHPGHDCSISIDKYLNYCNNAIDQNFGFQNSLNHHQTPLIMGLTPSLTLDRKCSTVSEFQLEQRERGVTLAWQDLSVYVPNVDTSTSIFGNSKSDKHRVLKQVLHNVTGIVNPGNLVAIIGASGAGKTTLMNVLAYRARGDVAITGRILANGIKTGQFMNLVSGYVHQTDVFCGSLTVAEHLHFMAKMKMDRRLRGYERDRRVEELLVELGLKKCENTLIGIPGEVFGISGGERKRLAFASEILTDPPLLFCDEPTTNLDSYSALKLVEMMRKMAAKGKTILCTIHQPSSQVFSLFDQLCLLADGRTAYMGTPIGALRFLKEMNYICPDQFNPADFFIRTLAIHPGKEDESKRKIRSICDAFANSSISKHLEEKADAEWKLSDFQDLSVSSTDSSRDKYILAGGHLRRPFWWTKTFWLTHRALVDSYRNPRVHVLRSIQKIILGLIVGLCFFGVNISSQAGIQDVQGALFVFINENSFPALYGVMAVFPLEFPLFLRENKAGLYDVHSYYLSKMAALLPGFIIEPLLFTVLAYVIIGLRASVPVFLFTCLVCVITANTAAACGCFFSAYFDDITTANCLAPIISMFMIISGLFINLQSVPGYLVWTKYFSWFLYSNEALSIGQWQGITNITCDLPTEPCTTTGSEVLESRGFDPARISTDLCGMGFIYVIFHVAAYFALLSRSRKN